MHDFNALATRFRATRLALNNARSAFRTASWEGLPHKLEAARLHLHIAEQQHAQAAEQFRNAQP